MNSKAASTGVIIFQNISKIIKIKTFFNKNITKENILLVLYFDEYNLDLKERKLVIDELRKLNNYFEVNHSFINKHLILFQGTLKKCWRIKNE